MLEKPEKVAAERVAATLVVAEKTARSQAGTSPAATTLFQYSESGNYYLYVRQKM